MSTDPSVLALDQLFQLCKWHPDVVHLLVSNPAALDTLSRYPEQAVAALSELDEPETIPYGLSSMGTADMLARVRNLSAMDVPYKSCDTLYAHNVVQRTLRGNMRRPRVVCTDEQAQSTGCDTLLFMRGPHQPYLPDRAGALGILLSATSRLDDWPSFENVYISQTKDYGDRQQHADDWRYAGRYELGESRSLDVDEVDALPDETFDHWGHNLNRLQGDDFACLRARVYLSVVDERENVTEADVTRCIAEHGDEIIKAAIRTGDIKGALRDGTIVLRAFTMRPVGYDVGIPLLLEQTRSTLEAEQGAEDDIEVLSAPPRGTKRQNPDSTRTDYPRPGPGPSASAPVRLHAVSPNLQMPRPKRSTVNAGINYCEDDDDHDNESPVRSMGPSPSGVNSGA
ncbi:hypothetical protein PENSPDRAFT_737481 [Peniophora sp. CONT]|nr:hypothetical protein PENSPDRAFT_737481 [Peniophora sp. CONT]